MLVSLKADTQGFPCRAIVEDVQKVFFDTLLTERANGGVACLRTVEPHRRSDGIRKYGLGRASSVMLLQLHQTEESISKTSKPE